MNLITRKQMQGLEGGAEGGVSEQGDGQRYRAHLLAGYAPAATCVLLPVPALQRAWRQHGRQWAGLYGQRRAQNAGYTSVSVPVPRGVLMQAIVEAMFVS